MVEQLQRVNLAFRGLSDEDDEAADGDPSTSAGEDKEDEAPELPDLNEDKGGEEDI